MKITTLQSTTFKSGKISITSEGAAEIELK